MQKPKRKERDKKKGRGEDVGARTEAEDWRAQTTCRTSHDDNERPRWPDLSLCLSLSGERDCVDSERRRAARNSSTRRFFAPPPIGSLAATSSAAALCAALRALRSNSDPALSLGHASRPSEFSPNFLAGSAAQSAAAQVISPAPSRKKKATETQRRTGVHLPTSAC